MNAKLSKLLKQASALTSGLMLAVVLALPTSAFAQTDTGPAQITGDEALTELTDSVPPKPESDESSAPDEAEIITPKVCDNNDEAASDTEADTPDIGSIICVRDESQDAEEPESAIEETTPDSVPSSDTVITTDPQTEPTNGSEEIVPPMMFLAMAETETPQVDQPKPGTISGFKLNDLNGDGLMQDNEPKMSGWTITLSKVCEEDSECLEDIMDSAVTDEDGHYTFGNVQAGTYLVCEVPQDGWERTYPKDSDCTKTHVDEGEDCFENFANMEVEEEVPPMPEVLAAITPPASQELVNTGSPFLPSLLIGLTILAISSGSTYLSRSKNITTTRKA